MEDRELERLVADVCGHLSEGDEILTVIRRGERMFYIDADCCRGTIVGAAVRIDGAERKLGRQLISDAIQAFLLA